MSSRKVQQPSSSTGNRSRAAAGGRESRSGSLATPAAKDVAPDKETSEPLAAKNRAVQQLQAEETPAALNFLARRGSEAEASEDGGDNFSDEAMANAERELAADAEWKRIQQNTFTRWANEHLRQANKQIDDLETDLSDGLKLISLIEVLSGKRMPRHNKKPNFRSQKLENVSIALQFLEMEGVTLVNIDSTDIVDCKLKLILGLIWTLILHYAISMPMWDGPPLGGGAAQEKTPKQRLMNWIQDKDVPVNNFTKDWQDGKAVGALVDSVAPGLCPDWDNWDPNKPVENAREAMDLADKWLNVPKLLTPEEIVNPNIDEQSMMTYLSQFPNAKLKPGAPLRKKTNVSKVRAYGPGLEPTGLVAKAPAKFTVETFGAGDGEVTANVEGPGGKSVPCEVVCNNDRKKTFSCQYFPEEEGEFIVKVHFSKMEIPKSPYNVSVEGFAGDASKVTASGPGLEPEGVVINKPTYFHIYSQNAGRGTPEVIVLDPKGRKDSVPVKISETDEPDVYKCEYIATTLGLHSINVFFAGNPIPKSPFGVKVSPASLPGKVWTSGKGLQPNGIRVNETVSFKVHTEGAGEGNVVVKILGPGGLPVRATSKKIDDFTTEYTYTPVKEGRHIVMVTFANQEIPRSPFEVNISPFKRSNIKAYGPGLKGGIVNKPAKFTVDTCGETGGLGFNIKGPSQAKINCDDNGDGSADVDYIPTAVGEYAVHILCDDEDIPGSPFMAQIEPQTDFDPDRVKVFGPGVENGVNPKETTHFTIDITDAGKAPLDVSIVDDLGEFKPKMKEVSEGIFDCSYQPRKDQHKQTVMINFGGVAVPGSPFRVVNDNPNDPSKVKVYGPGIEDGVMARKPVDFTIDCTKSGPGDLQVAIDSKSNKSVPISMQDNKDGTYKVNYEATEPGTQTINITLDGTEVPQSPIVLNIKPGVDLSKIKLNDFETEVFVDCTNEFDVDTSALPPNSKAKLTCDIAGPNGEPVDSYVSKEEPNGPFHVSYIPTEEGAHDIGLKYDGQPLPDSPYPVVASYGFDPTRVKAYGDGLEKGICDEPNEFIVETKNAGAGSLGLAIEGPSEAIMNCTDNKDGTATVDYTPTEEGDYNIAVKFGDEDIPGSPFSVPVSTRDGIPKANANKVKAYGPGLEPGNVLPGKPTHFTVDSSETGPAPVEVDIHDSASGKKIPKRPSIVQKPDGNHEVTYVPPLVGEPYEIAVAYGGVEIPGSPFAMSSNPNLEDVIDSPKTAAELGSGRKPSQDNEDLIYSRNGTGLQRKASKDSDAPGGVADLIRGTMPGGALPSGKERGGRPSDEDTFDDDGLNKRGDKFGRSNSRDLSDGGTGSRKSSHGDDGSRPGSRLSGPGSRTGSRSAMFDDDDGTRRGSQSGGDGRGSRAGSRGDLFDKNDPNKHPYGRQGSGHSLGGDPNDPNRKGSHGSRPGDDDSAKDPLRKGSYGSDGRQGSRSGLFDKDGPNSRSGSKPDLFGRDGRPGDGSHGSGDGYGPDGTRRPSGSGYGQGDDDDVFGSSPDGRRGSKLSHGSRGDEYNPDGSRKDGSGDGRYGADGSRRGSQLGGPRDGDGYGPRDGKDGLHGPNDGSRRGSQLGGPRDGDGSGGRYGPNDDKDGLYGPDGSRRGSQLGGPRDGDGSDGRYGLNDDRDGLYGPDGSRRGSQLGGPRDGDGHGPNDGKDGRYGPSDGSRRGSQLGGLRDGDNYGPNDGEDGRYGPNDGARRGSQLGGSRDGDGHGPYDGKDGRYGSKDSKDGLYGPNDGSRRGSQLGGPKDSDGHGPYDGKDGRYGSKDGKDGLYGPNDSSRRGSQLGGPRDSDGHGPYDGKDGRYGSKDSNDGLYGPNDGSRRGSQLGGPRDGDGHGPHDGKDGLYGPNDGSRRGSRLANRDGTDPNDGKDGIYGSGNRKGSGLGPRDGDEYDDVYGPGGRKGSRGDTDGRPGSSGDRYGPGGRRGSSDTDDGHGPNSRKGSRGNDQDGRGRLGSSSYGGPNDTNRHDPNSRVGGLANRFEPKDGRKGSSSSTGSPYDGQDGKYGPGSGFGDGKDGLYGPNDSRRGSQMGRGGDGYGPDGQRGPGGRYGANDGANPDGTGYPRDGDDRARSGSLYGQIPGEPGNRYGKDGFGTNDKPGDHDGPYGPGSGRFGDDGSRRPSSGQGRKGSGGSEPYSITSGPDVRQGPNSGLYGAGSPDGRHGGPDGHSPYGRSSSRDGLYGNAPGDSGNRGRRGSNDYDNNGRPGSAVDRYGNPIDAQNAGVYGSGKSPYGSRSNSRPDLFDKSGPRGAKSPYGSRPGSRQDLLNRGPDDSFPSIDLNNIPLPSTGGDIEAVVKTPSGGLAYPFIEDNGNGSIGLSYQPTERGMHNVDVKYNKDHVQGSPYKFYASPVDDNKVHAYGPGLTHGVCGDPAGFVISTKGAGAGGLALAVEGPSKADINCQDNKDGTVNVSYLPTAPGEYKISAKFADKHIEGSPFTCKVTGEGKKRNAISVGSSSDLSLPDNLSEYDLRALNAYIVAPSGSEEPCFLKKLPKGNTGISFTPKEIGEHLVSVKRDGKHIKNSPFKISVSPNDVGDASKVVSSGEGLSKGQTHQDNVFHVDTKNAGYGGLSLSVEGPSKAEIKCKDHEDGSLDVSYRPTEPGLYIVNLKFADQHVPGSPYAVAVSGKGSKKEEENIKRLREAVPVTEVGSQCRLTFKMPGINCTDLEASVSSPANKVNKAAIAELEDGLYAVNFVPYELGIHTVSVQYHDIDIPGSPFQFTVGPLQDGGAHRVHAGGSGLERGIQGQPADFNVWTREAGHGSLAISVEGPSKAVVDFKDRKDGSCHVSYTVEEPGEYSVGIRFNEQHIPGSPYKVYIQPSADDAERIRISNIADIPIKPDAPQTMLLNMNGADGDMECRIVAPSGREDDCFITPLGSGEHSVRFVPKEEGVHYLHARYNGVHIPGSPYKIIVGNVNNNDPSTVEVYGKGIQYGTTGSKSAFVIDTSSVGAGTLSITVDGPSKVDLSCNEVDSGYEVSYTPMVPGKYYVTVKYNGKNVSGSPFSVNINGDNLAGESGILSSSGRQRKSSRSSMTMETLKRTSYIRHQYTEQRTSSQTVSRSSTRQQLLGSGSDPSAVSCSGSGLRSAKINRHNSFGVDCSQAGNNILYVGVYGPETPCDEVVIKHQGNKRYSVDYVVRERGKYIIFVKWGEDHVPGSPYHIEV